MKRQRKRSTSIVVMKVTMMNQHWKICKMIRILDPNLYLNLIVLWLLLLLTWMFLGEDYNLWLYIRSLFAVLGNLICFSIYMCIFNFLACMSILSNSGHYDYSSYGGWPLRAAIRDWWHKVLDPLRVFTYKSFFFLFLTLCNNTISFFFFWIQPFESPKFPQRLMLLSGLLFLTWLTLMCD